MLGAVFGEIQLGLLKNSDEVGKTFHSGRPPSLFGSLKSGKSLRARRELASMSGWMTCVLILFPISLSPLRATISLKLAPFRIVTGGAKSSELPYLSETYLMNSMNRT